MTAQQETFIAHLIELRDRMIRALLALGIVFVCLMPWAGAGTMLLGANSAMNLNTMPNTKK